MGALGWGVMRCKHEWEKGVRSGARAWFAFGLGFWGTRGLATLGVKQGGGKQTRIRGAEKPPNGTG